MSRHTLVTGTLILGLVLFGGVIVYGTMQLRDQQSQIDDLSAQKDILQSELKANGQGTATQPTTTTTSQYTSTKGVKVLVYTPVKDAKVTSPVAVLGQVPGSWSFEASFPVELRSTSGTVIAKTTAQLLGDWMTDQLVPFSAKLTYTGTPTGTGTLVLIRDNPSGLPANDDTVAIPIRFD